MKKIIAVISNNYNCIDRLKNKAEELDIEIRYEIQSNGKIENKLTIDDIMDANAILFSVYGSVEEIDDIERFVDLEYYEVDSDIIIQTPEIVLKEIIEDIE